MHVFAYEEVIDNTRGPLQSYRVMKYHAFHHQHTCNRKAKYRMNALINIPSMFCDIYVDHAIAIYPDLQIYINQQMNKDDNKQSDSHLKTYTMPKQSQPDSQRSDLPAPKKPRCNYDVRSQLIQPGSIPRMIEHTTKHSIKYNC
eukprot:268008_1